MRQFLNWGPAARLLQNPLMQRVLRNSGYLFSGNTLATVFSFIQGIMAARLLGVEGLGLLGGITQFATVLNRLTSFNMSGLVVTYVGKFEAEGKERHAAATYKAALLVEGVSSFLALGLVVVLSPLIADVVARDRSLASLFSLYGLMILANLVAESGSGLLQHLNRFRVIAGVTVGQAVATLVLVGAVYFSDGGLREVVLAYLVGKVLWALGLTYFAFRSASTHWGPGWWRTPLSLILPRRRELIRFSVSTNLSSTLQLLTRDSEILWLGAFSTPLHMGYYKIARAIADKVTLPITPLIKTTYREVANEVGRKAWGNVRYLLRSGTILSALWTVPASIGLVVFGRWIISIYGENFLPTSYTSMMILLVGIVVANVLYWNQTALLTLGMPDYPTRVQFVAAILKIAGTVILVPSMGANGMALLLSLYLVGTVVVLMLRSLREVGRAELGLAIVTGD
jgi:O-antigen/teichoic acid export membrane protein